MSTSNTPAILVDGSSYLFRAFHALPPLTTSKGQPTGAIKGVVNMIRSLHKQYANSQVIVVFDAKGKTFRNDMYPEYKANRPPMPDDLRTQIQPIHDIITAMGLPLLVIEGVEADDVIGTLATQATEKGIDVIISTGDKDMAQLVSPHVSLINTMTDVSMDEQGVVDKFGVEANQIIDYLALMGDKVDNIPGVEKCGPKTAVKWLAEYNTLDGVIENAEKIKGKIGENLREAISFLPLSYDLATIKTDVELDLALEDMISQPVNDDALLALYQEYEFKTLLRQMAKAGGSDTDTTSKTAEAPQTEMPLGDSAPTEVSVIFEQGELDKWIDALAKAEYFAFDTETTSLDYMQAEVVGVSFATEVGKAAYVPLAHDYLGAPEQLNREAVLAQLKPLLEDANAKKVGQNLKYDKHVLLNHGIELQGIAYDTMLESYVLDAAGSRHDMDTLALKYLGHNTIHFEDVAGKGKKQLTFNQIEIEKAAPYAAEDADITLRLHEAIHSQLSAIPELTKVYEEIEKPLVDVLVHMEHTGTLIDANLLHTQSHAIGIRIDELEKQAYELAGEPFNLSSPKQLQVIFFEKLNMPIVKKTPKGAPSTNEEVLQELALDYPLPKLLLEHRSLSKLKSTYTDKLPDMISDKTGRVHTSYHQAVTATGRLSSTDPNLQNIPIRTEEGRRIRQAFVPRDGYKIVAADYSQIELRIMAHLSQDEGLLNAFANGIDIHKATAAEVFGVDVDDVTTNQRRSAKAINFGLIYGMSAFGLSKQLGIPRKQSQEYMNTYFERYPGVQRYMEETRLQATEDGYVETIFGRRLMLPEINSRNGMRRQAAERAAINAPMQGTAADIIKKAMVKVDNWLADKGDDAYLLMQVHDELVLEVKIDCIEDIVAGLKDNMENAVTIDVPLIVDVGIGDNWDEAH